MTDPKTKKTVIDPCDFIQALDRPTRKADALGLYDLYKRITGYEPRMWGPTIIGFGRYSYTYDSRHSGESLAAGFSPRKASLSLYIVPGYQDYGDIL